jgi:putative aldouronate transport system permease protein
MYSLVRKRLPDLIIAFILIIVFAIAIYPFYYTLVFSLNEGIDTDKNGHCYFWPRAITLQNYKVVFAEDSLFSAFVVTTARTLIGTSLSVFFTAMVAYPISRKHLRFRKIYLRIWVVTMYFGGGLIPFYLVLNTLGLIDKFAVYIFPLLFNAFNGIVFVNFFRQIPDSIEESAHIDGANDFYIFLKIIIPLSAPVIATITLFNGVGHWNSWFDSAFFTSNPKLQTLQCILWKIVQQSKATQILAKFLKTETDTSVSSTTVKSIQFATMFVSILPITLIYPFLQKYFVKGFMLGAVKE